MKRFIWMGFFLFGSLEAARSQIIITEILKAVINAADLVVQQVQNETIVLQNAEKEITNVMSKLQLDDITSWVQKQKDLYQEYYQELAMVKDLISGYDKLKALVQMQSNIVSEYQRSAGLFKQDKHFSATELNYMTGIYSGILDQSLKNLDQAMLAVSSLVTSMTDAQRIRLIEDASKGMQKNWDDLRRFNSQNVSLSLGRSKSEEDILAVKDLYGLE
jgi:hypothetical protein